MNEHTIVVRYPEGFEPDYSGPVKVQVGHVVAVDRDGNRLKVAQELEEALEELLGALADSDLDGLTMHAEPFVRARNALEEAQTVNRGTSE